MADDDDDDDSVIDCLRFREQCDSLRLAASSVAAMAGYHPYKDLVELAVDLVYQGADGRRLLRHDSTLLGISLTSKEEQLIQMLTTKNASQGTKQALEKAMAVGRGAVQVSSIEQASKIKQAVLQTAKNDKNLTVQDLLLLQEGTRSAVDTGYGTFHENDALNQFQTMTGCEIRNRNSALLKWPFIRAPPPSLDDEIIGNMNDNSNYRDTVIPMGPPIAIDRNDGSHADCNTKRKAEANSSRQDKKSRGDIDDDVGVIDFTTIVGAENQRQSKTTATTYENAPSCNTEESSLQQKPFFVIWGSVDGIRDEIVSKSSSCPSSCNDMDDDDEDDWTVKEIVVEVKHRMRQIYKVPPLYEQIQATVYCFMYNVTDADLVQVLRRNDESDKKGKHKQSKNASTVTTAAAATITTNSKADCLQEQQISESNPLASSTNNRKDKRISGKKEETSGTLSSSCGADTLEGPLCLTSMEVPCDSSANRPRVTDEPNDCAAEKDALIATPHEAYSVGNEKEKVVKEPNAPIAHQSKEEKSASLSAPATDKTETAVKAGIATDATPPLPVTTISASRISLDDPAWCHRRQWDEVILPRLCSFVQAVYEIRRNDDKRYRLLLAVSSPPKEGNVPPSSKLLSSTRDGWKILFDECPWLLRDCSDTAYHRNYM